MMILRAQSQSSFIFALINRALTLNLPVLVAMICIITISGCSTSYKPTTLKSDHYKDATPRVEPLLSGPNKPYTVLGKRYVPDTREIAYRKKGQASWYGKKFHGRSTSSGEKYNMYAMTAAHTTLPIPCYVHVTNVKNGRSVIVRVNDRGPFKDSRVIDLSYAAAHRLGTLDHGVGEVIVERILPADIVAGRIPATTGNPKVASSPVPQSGTQEVTGGFYIQVGVYSQLDNAKKMQTQLAKSNPELSARLQTLANGGYYKVYAGPYISENQAQSAGAQIQNQTGSKVLVLDRR